MSFSYEGPAYEGASTSYRLAHKGLRTGHPDDLSARELKFLRARSQNLIRNNGNARAVQMRLVANWVGAGIIGKWDDKRLQKLWNEFIKNPSVDGHGTLGNLQALWGNGLVESGEIFTRMVIKRRPGQTIPLALQTFEAEQLDTGYSVLGKVKNSIEYGSFGEPKKYHFWKRHPQTVFQLAGVEQNKKVPVFAEDVLHIFERKRPGQWRGIPELAPVITLLYDLDELNDATLIRQKAAQALGWIIKKRDSGGLPTMGAVASSVDSDHIPSGEEEGEHKIQKITPGGIHYLGENEDFEFASVQDIGDNFNTLLKQYYRTVASSTGLTYEQLTGDLSDVNFSSIRAGLIEFRKRLQQVQQLIFINLGLQPLAKRFKELASVYTSGNFANAKIKWILPKLPGVDQYKDTLSDIAEIRGGLSTLEDKLAERQLDYDSTIEQLFVEQGLNLVLDTNPVHNTKDVVKVEDAPSDGQSTDAKDSKAK